MQFDAHDRSYAPRIPPLGCDINTDRYLFGREARDYCIINLITVPVPRRSCSLSLSLSIRGPPCPPPLPKPPRSRAGHVITPTKLRSIILYVPVPACRDI